MWLQCPKHRLKLVEGYRSCAAVEAAVIGPVTGNGEVTRRGIEGPAGDLEITVDIDSTGQRQKLRLETSSRPLMVVPHPLAS